MEERNKQQLQRMSIYFPPELLDQVRLSAEKNRRSFNQEVLWILDRFLNKQKYQDRKYELSQQLLERSRQQMLESDPTLEERLAQDELYQAWLQADKDDIR